MLTIKLDFTTAKKAESIMDMSKRHFKSAPSLHAYAKKLLERSKENERDN